jgi:hypothetical protein
MRMALTLSSAPNDKQLFKIESEAVLVFSLPLIIALAVLGFNVLNNPSEHITYISPG